MGAVYKKLITALLFIILIQSVAPEGKYKKYVSLAAYLIVLSAFITPVIEFISGREYEDVFIDTNITIDEYELDGGAINTNEAVYQTINDVYEASLSDALSRELKAKAADCRAEVYTQRKTDGEEYGAIEKVYVYIKGECDEDVIKNTVNDFYNVPYGNIYIVKE